MKQRRRNVFKIGGGADFVKIISYNFYCQSRRGGCLRSGPIRKVGGGAVHFRSDIRKVGGRGGGAVHFRSDIRKCGGGQSTSGPIYEKWGGGQSTFGTQKIRYR